VDQPFPGGGKEIPEAHVGQGLAFVLVTAKKFGGSVIARDVAFNKNTQIQVMDSGAYAKIMLLVLNKTTANENTGDGQVNTCCDKRPLAEYDVLPLYVLY